jgi:hypothetical protein
MLPASKYKIKKKNVSRSVDGSSVTFSDVTWSRKSFKGLLLFSLSTLIASRLFKMSRYWYVVSFVPAALICYMDRKFVPYAEIENFYNYVYERRKAESLHKNYEKEIEGELSAFDQENYSKLKAELIKNNRTIYEVAQDLDEMYLQAAIRSEKN